MPPMSEAFIRRRALFGLLALPLIRPAQAVPQFIVQAVDVGADRLQCMVFLHSEGQQLVLASWDERYRKSA